MSEDIKYLFYKDAQDNYFRANSDASVFELLKDGEWFAMDNADFRAKPEAYISVSEDEAFRAQLGVLGSPADRRIKSLTAKYGRKFYKTGSGLVADSLCDDPEYKEIEREVEKKAREIMAQSEMGEVYLGSCHKLWEYKKQIFKNEYGIDWLSPAELNPHVMFD